MDSGDELDEVIEDDAGVISPAADTLADVVKRIQAAQSGWELGEVLDFGGLRWTPSLVDNTEKAVLHIHGTSRLRSFVVKRLEAARQAGYRVVVAAELAMLWNAEVLQVLALLDAEVLLTDRDLGAKPELLVTVLAMNGVRVTPAERAIIAGYLWNTRRNGATNIARGRRFEALVCFLLSQIEDFEIFQRNLRADTDELDVVVRVRRIEGRLWCESGVPFVLVEAKNYAEEPAPQKDLSLLITKLQTRRGRARLGFLVSATGITKDAGLQELKLAFTQYTIVVIGPSEIQECIGAADIDAYLDRLVGAAMLR